MDAGTQLAVEAVVGYVTVPLVSLLARRQWPSEVSFLIALAISAIAATVVVAADAGTAHLAGWSASFGRIFTAQQITWGLRVPGAGDERLNAKLLAVGGE